ncbi:MAG TPA: transglycosylase SLT domain-containing protein [Silvibacterium sp.]|nr:transglycosylase SLT domain-containing protein [Silvibacterium sp.]
MVVQRFSAALAPVFGNLLAPVLTSVLLIASFTFAPQVHAQQQLAAPSPPAQLPPAANERDRQLIQNVESAYQNGLSNYRDGHLPAAKSNFDYAVDLMLSSGIDLNTDQDLKNEFDRIVDAVNTLEMDALKQGIGLAPAAEPTPVDVASSATFTVDPTIRAEAEASLKTTQSDIPLVINDYVASFINFFLQSRTGHATIVASLNRAGRYKDMIQRVLKEEGVPQDLIYQAVAESGFRTQAINPRSGAGGMWQFMPGDTFAPPRSGWYDERFDPEQATRAYARYIKFLYKQLGDWYLAMAAYDWGAGNIQRAVQRTGYADFWELYRRNNLPAETKNYVPIILAVTILAKNPKQYGLDDLTPDPPLVVDTVRTDYSVDLRLVADVTDAPVQEIVALNPSLLRGATPPDDPFDLHLPVGTKELYEKRIAEIPEDKRRYWRYHKLAEGESIAEVARAFHVSASEIASVNQLSSTTDLAGADLTGIDALVIPIAPVSSPSGARTAMYRARKGDSLVTVGDRFGVTVDQLKRWNHLKSNAITPGHSLYVAEPARVPERSHKGHNASTASTAHGSSSHHTTAQASHTQTSPHSTRGKTTARSQTPRHTSSSQADPR